MADRIVYAICADDGKFETMTKEDILAAIEQAVEQGYVSDPDGAVFSRIKEIRAGQCEQLWVGTEAQFNALDPAPSVGTSLVRIGTDGVLYLCSDDSTLKTFADHIDVKGNPHGTTAKEVGALPTTGGNMTGNIDFGNNTRGLMWTMDDGTLVAIRPDVDLNLLQIVFVPKGGNAFEAFGLKSDGTPMFHVALPIIEGGTGATDAATARINLGAAAADHKHNASDISGGVIPVGNGGTGAYDAETARANLGAAAESHTHSKSQITDFPTSMPASDVRAWAKAESKPTYSAGEVGALPITGGDVTGNVNFGNNTHGLIWTMDDGTGVYLRPDVDGNLFQVVFAPPTGTPFEAFGIKSDGTPQFYKPLGIGFGGTGGTTKKAARKNLGAEIQCGVADNVGSSGVQITFPEAFSGVPVVTATGGSEVTSVYVRDITTTGFRLISGVGNNDGVQWQAIYISD